MHHDSIGAWPKFHESYLDTLQSKYVGMKSVGTKIDIWEKYTLSFLQEGSSIQQATNSGGGVQIRGVQWLFYFAKSYRSFRKYSFS